jgi:subfamily B ATP-binding cassette protein MsbA
MGLVSGTVMIVGGRLLIQGAMTIGDFFQFTLLLGFMVAPVFQVASIGTQLTEAFAGLDRMHEVLSERPEDDDPSRTVDLGHIEGHIRFEDVTFEYEAGKPVLRGISLDARPGSSTALVGSSGSGKSTLISLVAAFAKPISGRITVDGRDLSTARLDSYRSQLGVVLQDNFLFDGTIKDNILFGKPGATDTEIQNAVRVARVDEFVAQFDQGLDTIIGERGVKLSGGQRQRVAIARAILANPRILILDEATSSLDSESEALIQEGLAGLMRGRTTFVIAHRLSTIRGADQILVLEHGEIVERGTHDELLRLEGRPGIQPLRKSWRERCRARARWDGKTRPAARRDWYDCARSARAVAPIVRIQGTVHIRPARRGRNGHCKMVNCHLSFKVALRAIFFLKCRAEGASASDN